jgi:type IV secretion system protein VirB8
MKGLCMASNIERKEFSNYLTEAKSWETDKVAQLQNSAKKAWLVAVAAGVIAAISVITVAILGPQKTAVPYLVRVDNSTGNMEVVNAIKDGQTSYGDVLNKFNLQWYVRWREGYSRYTIADYYNNVGYMSAPKVQEQYAAYISKTNPDSPLRKYGGGLGEVVVTIKSITFLREGVALVRFSKKIINEHGGEAEPTHWLATIAFMYSGTPQLEAIRAINPLGFQALEYRLDADQTVGETQSSAAQPVSKIAEPYVPAVQ